MLLLYFDLPLYELLYNIIAYKQSQYIATYFSMQEPGVDPGVGKGRGTKRLGVARWLEK